MLNLVLVLQKLLCAYAFPQCLVLERKTLPLPLCYEDCIAVRDSFCYNDWAVIEDNKQRRIFLKSRGHFTLPNCDILPRHSDVPQGGQPVCSWTRLTEINQEEVTSKFDTKTYLLLFIVEAEGLSSD